MPGDNVNMPETSERRPRLETLVGTAESVDDARVEIQVLPDRGFLNLRLDPRHDDGIAAAARVLGQALPLAANTFTTGVHRVYWCGPDEWLIDADVERTASLRSELAGALTDCHAAINDVSSGHAAFGIVGNDARIVLAKGCTLDLDPRAFGAGQCARTNLARATVLLAIADDPPGCKIIVARSFADYLHRWLALAARQRDASS